MLQPMCKKLAQWENQLEEFPREAVENGPILENIQSGKNVDLFKIPGPKELMALVDQVDAISRLQ